MTDLTYKILAYKVIPNFNTDDCIDWAMELLENGIETPSLLILAGLSKAGNCFEKLSYFEAVLRELGIEGLSGEKAIFSHCYYYIKKISEGIQVRNNLAIIGYYYSICDYDINISDLVFLNWAWMDFEFGKSYSDYWDKASKKNIESIVIIKAKEWVMMNWNKVKITPFKVMNSSTRTQ